MLKERWPLILFLVTVAVSAPFWHELLPDEHYEQPAPAVDGHSPQAIAVFGRKAARGDKNPKKDVPWRIAPGPLALDLETWVGLPSRDVGCRMEKALGVKFSPYGCTNDLAPKGDPCVERTAYYAGPRYPRDRSDLVHAALSDVLLDFEAAKLREVTLRIHEGITEAEARRLIQVSPALDTTEGYPRAKFLECGDHMCLTLTAFAHQTADCSATNGELK